MRELMFDSRIVEILKHYIEELRRGLGDKLVKVILFGSYAKSVADEFSDIDILVVHRGDGDEVRAIVADVTLETCLRYDIPLEPITMNIHEFQNESLFIKEIKNTGVVLYSTDPEEKVVSKRKFKQNPQNSDNNIGYQ